MPGSLCFGPAGQLLRVLGDCVATPWGVLVPNRWNWPSADIAKWQSFMGISAQHYPFYRAGVDGTLKLRPLGVRHMEIQVQSVPNEMRL